ncbi:CASP-like protein 4A4 isoform X2 [Daucus carota subsp. sativus]|uniref:CASP-like protein 4A4 isoform X2 n=1 Tax=Daucus carota subsp. sativus TaxID=79200 RepID=UPI003082F9E3
MSSLSATPGGYSQHTPSPYSFSVASTRLSSRPSFHLSNLFLRSLSLVLSSVSALLVASPSNTKNSNQKSSFYQSPELLYCFIAIVSVFTYSAYQLFKGVSDITYRGVLISDIVSDYSSFPLDQHLLSMPLVLSYQATSSVQESYGDASRHKGCGSPKSYLAQFFVSHYKNHLRFSHKG